MGKQISVGVLEDDPIVRRRVVEKLHKADYKVVTQAASLEQGRQLIDEAPDAALIDLMLPDGEAFDLISELSLHTETALIVLSSLDDAKSVLRAFHAGADGYVLKDAQGFEIADAISHAIQGFPPISPAIARYLLTVFNPTKRTIRTFKKDQFLSKREREVLIEVANGKTRKEVARILGISPYTVAEYLSNIYRKYKVSNKSAAVARAIENRDI